MQQPQLDRLTAKNIFFYNLRRPRTIERFLYLHFSEDQTVHKNYGAVTFHCLVSSGNVLFIEALLREQLEKETIGIHCLIHSASQPAGGPAQSPTPNTSSLEFVDPLQNTLCRVQGQYLFWEPVDNYIPKMESRQPYVIHSTQKYFTSSIYEIIKTNNCDPKSCTGMSLQQRCNRDIHCHPPKSAIVRATFKIRSCARALNPCCCIARSSNRSASDESSQYILICCVFICEFEKICLAGPVGDPFPLTPDRSPALANRSCCLARAASTLTRISADPSAADPPRNSLYCTAGTSR